MQAAEGSKRPHGFKFKFKPKRFSQDVTSTTNHASTRSDTTATRRRRININTEAVLDGLETTCKLLSALADGLNVPVMKGVVQTVIEVVNIAKTVKSNQTDLLDLVAQVSKSVLILDSCVQCSDDDLSEHSAHAFLALKSDLEPLKVLLEELTHHGRLRRIASHASERRRIASCRAQLTVSVQDFVLASHAIQACHRHRVEHELNLIRAQNVAMQLKMDALRARQHMDGARADANFQALYDQSDIVIRTVDTQSKNLEATLVRLDLHKQASSAHLPHLVTTVLLSSVLFP